MTRWYCPYCGYENVEYRPTCRQCGRAKPARKEPA